MKRSVVAGVALIVLACAAPCAARGIDHPRTPNILFVIMDGNIDSVVNQQDVANWAFYNQTWGLSSVYDFNFDGLTNAADRAIIEQNLGLDCRIR